MVGYLDNDAVRTVFDKAAGVAELILVANIELEAD